MTDLQLEVPDAPPIRGLRRKLGAGAIQTVRGMGYRFAA
jgi:DNA-binding response OmpR family regulator